MQTSCPDLACEKSCRSLQDLVLLLEPSVLTPQAGEFGGLRFLLGQRFGRASRQDLIASAA